MSKPENTLLITRILASHVIGIINYLSTDDLGDRTDDAPTTLTLDLESKPKLRDESTFTLLLIGKKQDTNALVAIIKSIFGSSSGATTIPLTRKQLLRQNLEVEQVSIDAFAQLRFERQYDLGVLLHPTLFISSDSDFSTEDLDPQLNQRQINFIATKLRDLYAHQSLLYLNESVYDQPQQLRGFGYVLSSLDNYVLDNSVEIELSKQGTVQNHEDLQITLNIINSLDCWQFNLYDYKPRPDWLNARYWANPDNFNKYRW